MVADVPGAPAPPRCGPGIAAKEVDDVCRRIIADAGWAERFEHGTGHGVGLDIHEAPTVSQLGTAILAPGFVVTVEPGVYVPGHGGVRVEDTLVVTEDGAAPSPDSQRTSMAVSTNDLKNGMSLDLPEGLFSVVEFQHVKPGKGGAFVRTKLKNVRSGAVIERTYRADEKLEQAIIDKRDMQFLYRDGTDYVFMDTTSYEQMQVGARRARRRAELPEGGRRRRPADVQRRDRRRRPAGRGRADRDRDRARASRATGSRAPASRPPLETGLVVQVPLFVNTGRRDQGRHPLRRVPDPGLTARPPRRPTAPRPRPRPTRP